MRQTQIEKRFEIIEKRLAELEGKRKQTIIKKEVENISKQSDVPENSKKIINGMGHKKIE